MCYFGQMARDSNSEKSTLEWKTKLREQIMQIYLMRIFHEDDIVNAKAGEYSVHSGSDKKASRTGADKSAGKWLVTEPRSNPRLDPIRSSYICSGHKILSLDLLSGASLPDKSSCRPTAVTPTFVPRSHDL